MEKEYIKKKILILLLMGILMLISACRGEAPLKAEVQNTGDEVRLGWAQ